MGSKPWGPERRGCCHCILQSTWFCSFCTLTILANVGVILYSANWTMENESFSVPSVVTALDIFFCCVYFVESGLKLIVHRAYFFWNEDAGWNVFDLCLVVLAVYDQAMFFVWQSEEADVYNANMNFMRSLRIVKVSRILRLVRVIRIFRDLRCMLFSILWSFIPLFWCLVLIFFVILVFSLFLIQLATEFVIQANWAGLPANLKEEFLDYFGSVQQTMATLYMSSTGGVDWRVPYEVLAASGELSCAAFLAYIAFFEFAVFNVLTGVFVDHAMKVSAADRELALAEQKKKERTEAERLRDTCRLIDADGDGKISWPEFHAFLAYENGYRNMASLGLDIFDSKKFFKNLMVMTNQRDIEITQFVSGCMRMKGGATGIDLHSLYSDLTSLHRRQEELQTSLTLAVRLLQDKSIRKRSKLVGNRSQATPSPLLRKISKSPTLLLGTHLTAATDLFSLLQLKGIPTQWLLKALPMKPCLSDQFVQVPCCGPPQVSAWKEVFPSVQSASCSIRTTVSVPSSVCETGNATHTTMESLYMLIPANTLLKLQPCSHSAVEPCYGTRIVFCLNHFGMFRLNLAAGTSATGGFVGFGGPSKRASLGPCPGHWVPWGGRSFSPQLNWDLDEKHPP
eukprot:s232_g30.t1